MSIISDALKKAQTIKKFDEGKSSHINISNDLQRPPSLQKTEQSKRFYWIQWALLALAIVTAWIGFANFHKKIRSYSPGESNLLSRSEPAITEKPSQPISGVTPAKPRAKLTSQIEREFQLSGIALIEGKPLAIINGNVVQEGDQVRGARLVKVSQGMVTLDYRGEEIKLTLK